MNVDQVFALPCPDDTDAGALALYMQRLAEAVEAELLAQRTQIRKAYRPPCAVWRSVSTSGPISTSGLAKLGIDSSGLVFSNYGVQFVDGGTVFAPSIGEGQITFSEPGAWTIGVAVKMSETGGITTGSARLVNAVVYKDTPLGGQTITGRMDHQMTATSNGFEWATWQGTFLIGDDTKNYHWTALFTHGNAASTVQITAGDLFLWAYKVSSDDQIEVA